MSKITPLKNTQPRPKIAFQRNEMNLILDVYGRLVMSGQAKDYAIGAHKDQAVIEIFRRHAEPPDGRQNALACAFAGRIFGPWCAGANPETRP